MQCNLSSHHLRNSFRVPLSTATVGYFPFGAVSSSVDCPPPSIVVSTHQFLFNSWQKNKTMGQCAQRREAVKASAHPFGQHKELRRTRVAEWLDGQLGDWSAFKSWPETSIPPGRTFILIQTIRTQSLFFLLPRLRPRLAFPPAQITFRHNYQLFSSNSFSIIFLLMARQIVLTVPFLFLLLSTCPKPSPVNGIDANKKEENVDDGPRRDRIARQSSAGGPSTNKEFNGGIYWLAADGPDFQMWPAMGAAGYGSGGQQQQMANLGAIGQSNGQQQVSGQQQSANAGGQQPPSSMSGIQQQAIVAQQQQQMFPQIQQQGFSQGAFAGYGQMSGGQQQQSAYAGYLEKQISSYPVMIYTLADCIPCQRAKHLLAVHYPDVRAHYLELSGNEPWQQQLQIDLQYLTGAMTFPYIFVCGQYIGGSTELFELHESGQLRRLVSQCLQKPPPK